MDKLNYEIPSGTWRNPGKISCELQNSGNLANSMNQCLMFMGCWALFYEIQNCWCLKMPVHNLETIWTCNLVLLGDWWKLISTRLNVKHWINPRTDQLLWKTVYRTPSIVISYFTRKSLTMLSSPEGVDNIPEYGTWMISAATIRLNNDELLGLIIYFPIKPISIPDGIQRISCSKVLINYWYVAVKAS